MYRVALPILLAATLGLGACSVGSGAISSGFSDLDGSPSVSQADSTSFGASTGSIDRSSRSPPTGTRVAALTPDKAPTGSFEKAPAGALSDRDYSHTSLNAEKARDLINQYRADKGLKPLKLNAALTAAAKEHSRDLAKWDRISHYGSDGSNPWDRVKRSGYKPRVAAENVGTGQASFEEVLRGWKESPGHNKNLLLADGREMGLALVQDPKTEFKSFWTLVVGAAM